MEKKIVKEGPKRKLADYMVLPGVIEAINNGPYASLASMAGWGGKPVRGHIVGCHECGLTRTTLYKDGDKRICGNCRKEKKR